MRTFRLFVNWFRVCGTMLAGLAVVWLVAQFTFHLKLLNVQTGSMQPTFRRGDALVMRHISVGSIHAGMIVSYHSSRNPNELVTHRVVQANNRTFQTKGDALTTPDPAVRSTLLAGQVVGVVPGLGKFLGWFSSWLGLALCVYVPACWLLVAEVGRLERYYKRAAKYSLYKAQVV